MIEDVEFNSPIGKSDHVLIEFKLCRGRQETRNEDHKALERYNYQKGNFTELRKCFENAN